MGKKIDTKVKTQKENVMQHRKNEINTSYLPMSQNNCYICIWISETKRNKNYYLKQIYLTLLS